MESPRPLDAAIGLELDNLYKKIILINSEEAATESQLKDEFDNAFKKVGVVLAIRSEMDTQ